MGGDSYKSTFRSFPLQFLLSSIRILLPLHFLLSRFKELTCDSKGHLFLCSTSPQYYLKCEYVFFFFFRSKAANSGKF